jgi:kinesin family protein 5
MSSTELDCASRLFYRLIDPHTIEVAYPKEGETLQYSFDWVFDITDDQCSVY